jgi:hypothetical protein
MILKKLVPLAMVAFLALPISAIAHGILPSPGPHASPLDADKSAHTQSVETVTPQAGQENCSIVPLNQCHSHSIYNSTTHTCCLNYQAIALSSQDPAHSTWRRTEKAGCSDHASNPFPCPSHSTQK